MKEPTLASLNPLHIMDTRPVKFQSHHGLHGSFILNLPRVNRSLEMSRTYQVGDPVHLIDWKAFARTDQLIVREEREQALARVLIVLDSSASMHWPDRSIEEHLNQNYPTKFEIATRIALHLSHRHIRSGDFVQVLLVDENSFQKHAKSLHLEKLPSLSPRSPSDIFSLFDFLVAEGFLLANMRKVFDSSRNISAKQHILYWIGDMLDCPIPADLFAMSHHLILFHVLSSLERDVEWLQQQTCYFDESLVFKEFLGEDLKKRDAYKTKLAAWCKGIENNMKERNGYYGSCTEKSSLNSYNSKLDAIAQWLRD